MRVVVIALGVLNVIAESLLEADGMRAFPGQRLDEIDAAVDLVVVVGANEMAERVIRESHGDTLARCDDGACEWPALRIERETDLLSVFAVAILLGDIVALRIVVIRRGSRGRRTR